MGLVKNSGPSDRLSGSALQLTSLCILGQRGAKKHRYDLRYRVSSGVYVFVLRRWALVYCVSHCVVQANFKCLTILLPQPSGC